MTKKNETKTQHNMCCHYYTLTNINNVKTDRVLLQTTGGKDEPNIVCYAKIDNGHHSMALRT